VFVDRRASLRGGGARLSPRSRIRPASSYRVEALAKGLRVLTTFSEVRSELTLSELSEMAQLPMPTTFRMVSTLEEAGYLERLSSGAYRPGLRVLTLGHATLQASDLVQLSEPSLQALADLTGQTVNLAVLLDDRILYLVRIRNSDLVTANIHVGSTLPAAYSSIGKVLLADLDPDEFERRIDETSLPRGGGPNAVSSIQTLALQLSKVRSQGFAIQDEEVAQGLRSIAAPIHNDQNKVVAGINITVKASDFTVAGILRKLKEPLLATAHGLSGRLGGR
jgi:IclR family pca regulon transcriptional regulator